MKKIAAVLLAVLLVVLSFTACSNGTENAENNESKIKVVTTIFPIYDWVKNIDTDGDCDISFLLNSGADLHSYQPKADDMVKMADCDMFIYVGGESDKWVDDALGNAVNKNMVVINLLDVLKDRLKEEELKEGMQGEEEEEEGEEEEGPEYDEHIWLSLKNAQICVTEIASKLSEIGKEGNAFTFYAKKYNEKLAATDKLLEDAIAEGKKENNQLVLIFGDRFPFRYLVDDYGIDYYAAFVGCSAESEASFETVTFLANKLDELKPNSFGRKSIVVLESSDEKLAKTIIENTKDKSAQIDIIKLNSMQSITQQEVDNGADYDEIMLDNVAHVQIALGINDGNGETE